MKLFDQEVKANVLPYDGTVAYYGKIFSAEQSSAFHQKLFDSIAWRNDEALMFGKLITTKRKVAWYADKAFSYTYSKVTKHALPWTPELLELKQKAEQMTKASYNSCLLNLYHDGSEGMAWHSDGEKELEQNASIASFSFGAERKFSFKHKRTAEVVSVLLEDGSLLEMKGATQQNWLHRLPPVKAVLTPRINLTFRKMNG